MNYTDLRSLPELELRKKIVEKYGEGEDFGTEFISSKTRNISELLHEGDPYSEEYIRRTLEFESH